MGAPIEDLSIIYDNTLDGGRYRLRVIREDRDHGYLTITRTEDETILDEGRVWLSYGAAFGPDLFDVQEWEDRTIKVVDNLHD